MNLSLFVGETKIVLVNLLQINYTLFQEINAPAGLYPLMDMLMIFCANSLIFFFPFILVMLWGRPLNWRRQPMQQNEAIVLRECRVVVIWTGVACILAYGLNLLIEQFVFEPRPFASHHVHLLIAHAADSSFPSDHTSWAFAVVGMLLFSLFPAITRTYRRHKEEPGQSCLKPFLVPLFLLLVVVVLASGIGIAVFM